MHYSKKRSIVISYYLLTLHNNSLTMVNNTSPTEITPTYVKQFLAHDSTSWHICLARYMLSPVRLSVSPSVYPSDSGIIKNGWS